MLINSFRGSAAVLDSARNYANLIYTAITVNLSVMLTMTYLLISVLKKLPPTPYVKWIEYWLIFAQMIPFIKAVLITSIQWLMENAEKNQTESRRASLSVRITDKNGDHAEAGKIWENRFCTEKLN